MLQNSVFTQTILWSNSFNTPSDWVINNTAGTLGLGWEFSSNPAVIPVTQLSPFASTTASNGFLFVNSDGNNSGDYDGTPIITTATTSATINLTGQPVVRLRYQHNFRWWHDTRGVSVSADNGATWTDFEMSNDANYSTPNQSSGNPEQTEIDISSIAGNQAQVKIRFYYNDNDLWAWYWAVDDVALFIPEGNDLVMLGGYWGSTGAWGARLPYYQIPLSQLAPLDVSGIVKNNGALDQNDVVFTAALASGTWSESSVPTLVPAGATNTISLTAALTPPAIVATHEINMSISSSATDAVPADNSILAAASVSVNNYIYARDKGTATNGTYNQGEGFEAGNIFDIFAPANLSGIDAYIGANAVAGAEVYAKLYSVYPGGNFEYVDESAVYMLTTADLGQKITLALSAGAAPLSAGLSYLVVLGSWGDGGVSNGLVISTAGVSEALTSYYFDMTDQTWYYTTSTPMVRMNFDPSLFFPTSALLSGTATICPGATTNLSVVVTGGVPPYTVTVTDGTNNYSATSASPVSIPVSPSVTSTYTILSVTGGGGTCTENSGTATVTLTPIPEEPTGLSCWQIANLNTSTCLWDVSGTQAQAPTGLSCWQTTAFNTATCTWDVSGEQEVQPTLACYETAVFNTTTCAWVISGPKTPQKMSYQAVIRNSADSLLISTPVGMRISLVQGTPSGTVVFSETQTATTNANGLVSLQIGMGTVVTGTFACIDWAAGPYYVKTETDLAGGTNYTIISSNEIQSVPYALFSENGIAPGTVAGEMNYWNGTAWVTVAPGTNNQNLTFCNGVPTWGPCPE
jgi:hypothetical protein